MLRKYLGDGEQIYCTGCKLVWDAINRKWHVVTLEDDSYYDGRLVEFEDGDVPYVDYPEM